MRQRHRGELRAESRLVPVLPKATVGKFNQRARHFAEPRLQPKPRAKILSP